MPRDGADPPCRPGQAQRCFEIIGAALAEAGASFEHVRTRMYITPQADFDEVGRAHEIFGHPPCHTTVVIAALVDPRWHLEIDVDAVVT